jgi:hypothetical protein
MTRILISYRREDTGGWAGRLYDQLAEHFQPENVFLDLDTIEPGVDFVRRIQSAVEASDVVLVLIGRRWLSAVDEAGESRIQDPDDWVRAEIRMALERSIWTIPILIDGASLPPAGALPSDISALVRRNAFPIGTRFREDVELLIQSIERGVVPSSPRRRTRAEVGGREEDQRSGAKLLAPALIGVSLVGLVVAFFIFLEPGGVKMGQSKSGTVSINPNRGAYEQQIAVSGTGWPANEELEVSTEFGLARTRVTAAADGSFNTTIRLSPDFKPIAPDTVEVQVSRIANRLDRASALYTILK